MSRRHRKMKNFLRADENLSDEWFEPAKGKKPRGKDRRRMQKPAFYDF